MKLFKGDTIKRLNKMMDKSEARKQKLVKQVEDLKQEKEEMRQAVENDLQESIIEDKEPSKKLSSDHKKISEELENAQLQLSQIDNVVQAEFDKAKEAVQKEIKEFQHDEGEEFNVIFNDLNQLKIQYLNKLIEYHKKKHDYNVTYRKNFTDVIRRVGLTRHGNNPNDHFTLSLNWRHQIDGKYSPMVTPEELREAINGEMPKATEKNKDTYKK